MELNKIYNMDCLKGMKQLEDNSIDLVVTDPPYGYSFMGKDWDKSVPSIDIWKECLRVLKPGAFAFIMSAPRSDVQAEMIKRLEKAGFIISFTPIYWTYASGFPKAMNIGKMIDKRLGAEREVTGKGKPHVSGEANENNWNSGYKLDYEKKDIPATPQAKQLDGSYAGFQPKPAVEIILVVMKPLSEKSYVDQAMKNGKGVTWLDDARVPCNEHLAREKGGWGNSIVNADNYGNFNSEGITKEGGRFPANLLVSDDVLNDGTISKGGGSHNGQKLTIFNQESGNIPKHAQMDSGQFSRYFSLDAWWENRLKKLPEEVRKTFPFLIVPKASSGEKNNGIGNKEAQNIIKKNIHPTVKPLKLFSYLITLGSRRNDLILDPFIGSGTAGLSAHHEHRNFIGFEMDIEYHKIAEARINHIKKQKRLGDY